MTDNFNFLGLPSVVQDLITNEIVHNSIPEDRIQLALTSKYCNELVQRAKPKKIIDRFWIQYNLQFAFISNSRKYTKTKEQLMEILPNCQIKRLQLDDELVFSSEDYLEIMDIISEAARFATKFDVIFFYPFDKADNVVGFYVKLKHLKTVTLSNLELILPYYPSKMKLNFGFWSPSGNILEDLAEKSQNCPLSFLELDCRTSFDKCQQLLQTAKFSSGAEICILNYFPLHLTYVGQNIFSFEMFSDDSLPIFIRQKFVGRNKRILKLKTSAYYHPDIAFHVVSASNPDKNYFSGLFKKSEEKMLISLENVDRDEILVFKSVDEIIKHRHGVYYVDPIYSAAMLESAFPTTNFTTPEERVEKINNMLGTNIQLIHADNVELLFENQDSAS